ncbi:hypothetical protein C8Q74DRAFT_35985 [Fomes fomentarius]|nr:hypothetical protein C8Q74DRAFT_35985 [Fomes fomentarius]
MARGQDLMLSIYDGLLDSARDMAHEYDLMTATCPIRPPSSIDTALPTAHRRSGSDMPGCGRAFQIALSFADDEMVPLVSADLSELRWESPVNTAIRQEAAPVVASGIRQPAGRSHISESDASSGVNQPPRRGGSCATNQRLGIDTVKGGLRRYFYARQGHRLFPVRNDKRHAKHASPRHALEGVDTRVSDSSTVYEDSNFPSAMKLSLSDR